MQLQARTARAGCCKAEQRSQGLYEGLPNQDGPRACKLGSAASINASAAAARGFTKTSCCAAATWRDAGSFGVQEVPPSGLRPLIYESGMLRAVAQLSSRSVVAPLPRVGCPCMAASPPLLSCTPNTSAAALVAHVVCTWALA